LSYIAVIVSLLAMRIAVNGSKKARTPVWSELRDGWEYVSQSVPIRSILLLLGLVSLAGMPYAVLMPIFASDVLGGGAHTLGFLMTASGVGALAGAVTLALRRTVLGLGRRIVICCVLTGVSLAAFGLSGNLWLSLFILPFTGFGMMQQMAASNTILQTIVDDEKRGRVMAFYSMAFQGMAPFGSLIAGVLAARIGAPRTIVLSGLVCTGGAAWFAWKLPELRQFVRPVYARLGILPQVALGVHSASELQTPPEQ
jgi:MFS family permease